MKAKIIVATHKEYKMPKDELYVPLHVGAKIAKTKLPYQRDDDGKNISDKNPYYCELTGLYWAWKNQDKLGNPDYIGLAHYRRHFTTKKTLAKSSEKRLSKVLKSEELDKMLEKNDIVLPKKRNYYIENLYDHYVHTLRAEPLDITGKIIKEKYPKYYNKFKQLKKRKTAHMFNMAIMKKDIFNDYCAWLFDILGELEKRVDISDYDAFQARFLGRVSELLLDIYINTNKLDYVELPVVDIESINWVKKGFSFLAAKMFGRKYNGSF